ncbi:hypothetical protein GQ457_14G021700 [Hibiscus cannabinus]
MVSASSQLASQSASQSQSREADSILPVSVQPSQSALHVPVFTPTQYQQILEMINHTSVPSAATSANLAGDISCFSARTHPAWILDSGATDHMCSDFLSLINPLSCLSASRLVFLPNGKHAQITHTSSINLFPNCMLHNVLHIPDFTHNLISVSKLTKDLGCVVLFYPDFCLLQDISSGKMRGIGKLCDGLYYFFPPHVISSLPAVCNSTVASIPSTVASCTTAQSNKTELWHARLGHATYTKLHKLSFPDSIQTEPIKQCTICPLAKQPRLSFPISTSRSSTPFELLHFDLWGPYRISTVHGHRFFLTIVDDHSRMTWVFLLRLKSDTVLVLKNFFSYIQTHFSATVKFIRSDNGTEFFNSACSEFFSSLGIVHQSSCPSTPQQNGVAERKHRHLLEVARALKFHSHIPVKFWGYCIQTACYLINRLPSSVLNWKTPFEILFKHAPNLSHLRVFGCLGYATNPNPRDKFAPRVFPAVFLGYSSVQKGYILYNLESQVVFVNRDVTFHENV